jgi:aldose 1-epimerase
MKCSPGSQAQKSSFDDQKARGELNIDKKQFGTTDDTRVYLYTLTNGQGMELTITNYGGAITAIKVPDRKGDFADVVLGFNTLAEYVKNPRYFGAIVGRYANRIGRGEFSLNGKTYHLTRNNGPNHLHGGNKGFDKVVWDGQEETGPGEAQLRLNYESADGEEGYPANLRASVTYTLFSNNELRIDYRATTDRDTIVNLSNHSYFTLAGSDTILNQELTINADRFTPVTEDLIPTGEIREVRDSPMDFTRSVPIGARITEQYDQLTFTGGYDHNFVLTKSDESLRLAARVYESTSGRILEVLTTQPGIQFYSGNFLDGSFAGKGGTVYKKYSGFCLEPQHFPDSPNHPAFPTTVLKPGEEYSQTSVFRFSAA